VVKTAVEIIDFLRSKNDFCSISEITKGTGISRNTVVPTLIGLSTIGVIDSKCFGKSANWGRKFKYVG